MPLGFISLTENLMMIVMAVWMAIAALGLATGGVHTLEQTPAHIVEMSYISDADVNAMRGVIPHHAVAPVI